MKLRQGIKIVIDIAMLLLLPVMMQYMLTEQELHEQLGVLMAVLFILHHVLNLSWIKNLFRGKYTAVRAFANAVNVLLLADMVLLAFSGIMMSGMSGYVFEFLHLDGDRELYKKLHMLGAYWGFAFMSFHLGQHWGYVAGMFRKYFPRMTWKTGLWVSRGIVLLTAIYGLSAFIRQNMARYLFLKTAAIYFDEKKHISAIYGTARQ